MDISAVLSANDDVFKELGLITAGDRLRLLGFCSNAQDVQKNTEKESKKKKTIGGFLIF